MNFKVNSVKSEDANLQRIVAATISKMDFKAETIHKDLIYMLRTILMEYKLFLSTAKRDNSFISVAGNEDGDGFVIEFESIKDQDHILIFKPVEVEAPVDIAEYDCRRLGDAINRVFYGKSESEILIKMKEAIPEGFWVNEDESGVDEDRLHIKLVIGIKGNDAGKDLKFSYEKVNT